MKSVLVLCAFFLTACSTQAVRCERHLTPINVPRRPVMDAIVPNQSKEVNGDMRGTAEARVRARMNADPQSGEPKGSTPAAVGTGTP